MVLPRLTPNGGAPAGGSNGGARIDKPVNCTLENQSREITAIGTKLNNNLNREFRNGELHRVRLSVKDDAVESLINPAKRCRPGESLGDDPL
jgi:hypothetical protein